jgi:hypothetical protein
MSARISTIKPDLTGNYSTLATWEDAADSAASDGDVIGTGSIADGLWAECYGGGSLGSVTLSGQTAYTASSTKYMRIYAATGHQHQGVYNSTKARIDIGSSTTAITLSGSTSIAFTQIDGIQFLATATVTTGAVLITGVQSCTIANNLMTSDGTGKFNSNAVINAAAGVNAVTSNVVYNNIIYAGPSGAAAAGINIASGSTANANNCKILNKTRSLDASTAFV